MAHGYHTLKLVKLRRGMVMLSDKYMQHEDVLKLACNSLDLLSSGQSPKESSKDN